MKQRIGNRFGEQTRDLVWVFVDKDADELVAAGYDTTCCYSKEYLDSLWSGTTRHRDAGNEYRNGWECQNCGEWRNPQRFARVPIGLPVGNPGSGSKDHVAGDAFQAGAHLASVLRNHVTSRINNGHAVFVFQAGPLMENAIKRWWAERTEHYADSPNADRFDGRDDASFEAMRQQFRHSRITRTAGTSTTTITSAAYQPVFFWDDSPIGEFVLVFGCHDPDDLYTIAAAAQIRVSGSRFSRGVQRLLLRWIVPDRRRRGLCQLSCASERLSSAA